MKPPSLPQSLLALALAAVLGADARCAWVIHRLSAERELVQEEYGEVNSIRYGLLSVDEWKTHLQRVTAHEVRDFHLTPDQESALKDEVSKALNALITAADAQLAKPQPTFRGKLRKLAVRTFVNTDDLRASVPGYADTILKEMEKKANTRKLKRLVLGKVDDLAARTRETSDEESGRARILERRNFPGVEEFDAWALEKISSLRRRAYLGSAVLLGSALLFLGAWFLARGRPELHKLLFVGSAALGMILLASGLSLPMMEIDARIKSVDFVLAGERIQFRDQVVFFRSKSIFEVVRTLAKTRTPDALLVSALLLVFSIVFPFAKLVSTELYLLGGAGLKRSRLVNFFAFKSGKWSMADVTVVAIFMAFIGSRGILDSQLAALNVQTSGLQAIAADRTSLQPGFIIFTAFVLYGLALSEILKKITPDHPARS